MIRRDDEKIPRPQLVQESAEARVKSFKLGGITERIAAVAINRIEIDEIGEDQAAIS